MDTPRREAGQLVYEIGKFLRVLYLRMAKVGNIRGLPGATRPDNLPVLARAVVITRAGCRDSLTRRLVLVVGKTLSNIKIEDYQAVFPVTLYVSHRGW